VDQDTEDMQRHIQHQIAAMESEHRDLDSVIERLGEVLPFDQLKLQRLKKTEACIKGRDGTITKPDFAGYHCLRGINRAS
jgi:hypothetical protein